MAGVGRVAGKSARAAVVAAGLCACAARALEYGPTLAQSEWSLHSSPLECRLSQSIPLFGEAVFRQGAGESPRFQLNSQQRLYPGDARLQLESPPWREPIAPILLASVPVRGGSVPVQIDESLADRLVEGMIEGLSPVFDRLPSNSRSGHSSVRLTSLNFRAAYTDYRQCLTGLLRGSFADVSRLRIGYDSAGYELDDTGHARLDLLVQHLKLRKDVKAIYVDGYSDNTGLLKQALDLSQLRAEAVTAYLVAKGVPAGIITTRFHGARYPVARGNSAAARAQNRRVTVRVERG